MVIRVSVSMPGEVGAADREGAAVREGAAGRVDREAVVHTEVGPRDSVGLSLKSVPVGTKHA